jgi:hypothetical protein
MHGAYMDEAMQYHIQHAPVQLPPHVTCSQKEVKGKRRTSMQEDIYAGGSGA